jgi:hypothetical protein
MDANELIPESNFDYSTAEYKNQVSMFANEMLIKDTTSTLNLDTIYSLYRRWCPVNNVQHLTYYYFRRHLTNEISYCNSVPYVGGIRINTEAVKALRTRERSTNK